MNPLPIETLGELARHTAAGFVESQEDLLNLMVKPPHQASKAHMAAEHPKPGRKRPVSARRKAVVVTA
jgi:hypothetical protein